jgi:WD40 repeat protein
LHLFSGTLEEATPNGSGGICSGGRSSVPRMTRLMVGFESGMILSCLTTDTNLIHTSTRIGNATTVHKGSLTSLCPFGSNVSNIQSGNVSCHTIVSSSNVDHSIRMWNVVTNTLIHSLDVSSVYWVGIMSEWSICIGTNIHNGSVHVLDVAKPPKIMSSSISDGDGIVVQNNKYINDNKSIIVRGHGGQSVTTVCISMNTDIVATGSLDGRVCVWSGKTGILLHTMKEEEWLTCTCAALNTIGNVIMTGTTYRVGSSNVIRPCLTIWRLMWNGNKKRRTQSMKIQKILNNFCVDGTIDAMSFCANEKYFLTATSDYQIRLWNVGGGPLLGTMEMRYGGQPQTISRLGTIGGDNQMLYVFAEGIDGSYRKWNRLTGIKGADKSG